MTDAWFEMELRSERLSLSPLQPRHADELFPVLDDERLHTFIGGKPLALEELRTRYTALASRRSPDGAEKWLNWIIHRLSDGAAIGLIEATVSKRSAILAWIVGTRWQRRRYASEAVQAAVQWSFENLDIDAIVAHVHPAHLASERVAVHAGLTVTDEVIDGERVWRLARGDFMVRRAGRRLGWKRQHPQH
jgi:RimJ/RimL family protein N-acetyltransferase